MSLSVSALMSLSFFSLMNLSGCSEQNHQLKSDLEASADWGIVQDSCAELPIPRGGRIDLEGVTFAALMPCGQLIYSREGVNEVLNGAEGPARPLDLMGQINTATPLSTRFIKLTTSEDQVYLLDLLEDELTESGRYNTQILVSDQSGRVGLVESAQDAELQRTLYLISGGDRQRLIGSSPFSVPSFDGLSSYPSPPLRRLLTRNEGEFTLLDLSESLETPSRERLEIPNFRSERSIEFARAHRSDQLWMNRRGDLLVHSLIEITPLDHYDEGEVIEERFYALPSMRLIHKREGYSLGGPGGIDLPDCPTFNPSAVGPCAFSSWREGKLETKVVSASGVKTIPGKLVAFHAPSQTVWVRGEGDDESTPTRIFRTTEEAPLMDLTTSLNRYNLSRAIYLPALDELYMTEAVSGDQVNLTRVALGAGVSERLSMSEVRVSPQSPCNLSPSSEAVFSHEGGDGSSSIWRYEGEVASRWDQPEGLWCVHAESLYSIRIEGDQAALERQLGTGSSEVLWSGGAWPRRLQIAPRGASRFFLLSSSERAWVTEETPLSRLVYGL